MVERLRSLFSKHQRDLQSKASEAELQTAIAEMLETEGIAFERERSFSPRDRIDFMLTPTPALGIEVKVAGSGCDVSRQLWRYAGNEEVESLLLVTTRMQLRRMPPKLRDKSVSVIYIPPRFA